MGFGSGLAKFSSRIFARVFYKNPKNTNSNEGTYLHRCSKNVPDQREEKWKQDYAWEESPPMSLLTHDKELEHLQKQVEYHQLETIFFNHMLLRETCINELIQIIINEQTTPEERLTAQQELAEYREEQEKDMRKYNLWDLDDVKLAHQRALIALKSADKARRDWFCRVLNCSGTKS